MTSHAAGRPVDILMIEDNAGDARLVREGLAEGAANASLRVVTDGEEALAYLRRQGPHAGTVRPDLILLDLNLPRKSGREVLAEIKADPELRRIPVLVLSTSQAAHDVLACYDLHANCYLPKPVDLDQFLRMVRGIVDFWLTIARLPREE